MRRVFAVTVLSLVVGLAPLGAHKPITSPYTFTADVRPILAARCATCHAPGGVAPMSLLTQIDTVPWGESMRLELMAGHMPPWSVDHAPSRFRNASILSARELNILLTWAAGGTPPGDVATADVSPQRQPRTWPLGPPDVVIPLPAGGLRGDEQERIADFVVPTRFATAQWLRAVDLLPGTPAIVRSATVAIGSSTGTTEATLALWQPGDEPIPTPTGAAFQLAAGTELSVKIRYRKTWQYEGRAMSDRSSIGLYFAHGESRPIRTVAVSRLTPTTLNAAARVIAIYASDVAANAAVMVTAVSPGGRREELIAFHPAAGWTRRFWYAQPIALPRGTAITVRTTPSSSARVTLDVVGR